MAVLSKVARERSDVTDAQWARLQHLITDWALLADLGFADLVLWVPTWNQAGWVAAAQVRPSTGPTSVPEDMVGRFSARGRRPMLDRAQSSRQIVAQRVDPLVPTAIEAIPVLDGDSVTAVVSRHTSELQRAGGLERAYLTSADDLASMVVTGEFPLPDFEVSSTSPRVGDGMLRLGVQGIVEFASPNALSALRRLGLGAELMGMRLDRIVSRLAHQPGPVDEDLAVVASASKPGTAEVSNESGSITLSSVPLSRDGRPVGGLVLVRDVTELRTHERELLTKDATIREIHHRVKNNLQTVAALLRLQSRRMTQPEAREALEEAVRRVGAIAAVHESLAFAPGEEVDFDGVAQRLLALAVDLGNGVSVQRVGEFGVLPAEVAMPLAMALAELLANAVGHGLDSSSGRVRLMAKRTGRRLDVKVEDDGVGLPKGFEPQESSRLGIQIVRTLVMDELGGTVSWGPRPGGGTVVEVDLLLA